jgi:integrase
MTKPLAPENRRRRRRIKLSTAPGTAAALIPMLAAERRYGHRHQKNIRHALREFWEVLKHDPRPEDFTAANLDALQLAMEARNASHDHAVNTLRFLKQLWAWCAERKLAEEPPLLYRPQGKPGNRFGRPLNPCATAEPEPREVSYLPPKPLAVDAGKPPRREATQPSTASDSLWTICQSRYFPLRPRIGAKTRYHYRLSICRFEEMLGRGSTVDDLTDERLAEFLLYRSERGRAAETCNGDAGRLLTLWGWLARKGRIGRFPSVENLKEPRRIPLAWRREELNRLMEAVSRAKGFVAGKPAADWFSALLCLIGDARGERISAALAIRKDWIDWQTGDLLIVAEARKSKSQDMACRLTPHTLALLRRIVDDDRDLVFGEPDLSTIYRQFREIRSDAGLPTDRRSAFHRIRRSLATALHVAGLDATAALGHSSNEVTRRSYIDPRIAERVNPAAELPFHLGRAAAAPARRWTTRRWPGCRSPRHGWRPCPRQDGLQRGAVNRDNREASPASDGGAFLLRRSAHVAPCRSAAGPRKRPCHNSLRDKAL